MQHGTATTTTMVHAYPYRRNYIKTRICGMCREHECVHIVLRTRLRRLPRASNSMSDVHLWHLLHSRAVHFHADEANVGHDRDGNRDRHPDRDTLEAACGVVVKEGGVGDETRAAERDHIDGDVVGGAARGGGVATVRVEIVDEAGDAEGEDGEAGE